MKQPRQVCFSKKCKKVKTKMAVKSTKIKFVTGKVRFSFAHVFEPAETLNGTMKYSSMILIPKSDKDTITRFNKAFEECKAANANYFGGTVPKVLKGGLRDGATEREDDLYADYYFINASGNEKPGVVDADLNPIIDPSEFYSGCYGRASITFYPYDVSGSKGIAAGLNNVQKLEDGEKFNGATSAAADFAI
jgi:hypothetical protein